MLDLGVRTQFLYLALRLTIHLEDEDGNKRTGRGTGFVVRREDGELGLFTNRHVLDPPFAGVLGWQLKAVEVQGFNYRAGDPEKDERIHGVVPNPAPIFPKDDGIDLGCIPVSQIRLVQGSATKIDAFVDDQLLAREDEFGNDISAGDFLCAPGYTALPEMAIERPVFLVGVVASDPRVPVEINPKMRREPDAPWRAVLYQSLSRAGLSGAPVLAAQRGLKLGDALKGPPHRELRVVGVNAGHFEEAGLPLQYSQFVRSDEVLALLATL